MPYVSRSEILQEVKLCLLLLTLQLLQLDVWHNLTLQLGGIEIFKSPTVTLCSEKSFYAKNLLWSGLAQLLAHRSLDEGSTVQSLSWASFVVALSKSHFHNSICIYYMFLVSRNKKLLRACVDCWCMYATLDKDYYYYYYYYY